MAATLYPGRVVAVDPAGPIVVVPTLGRTAPFGPLPTLTPDLAVGEAVAVSNLTNTRDQLVVLGRMSGRVPTVEEIPGLAALLDAQQTSIEALQIQQTTDDGILDEHGDRLDDVDAKDVAQDAALTAVTTTANNAATAAAAAIPLTQKGAASGVAELDAATRVPTTRMPIVQHQIRTGSVTTSVTSDAGSGAGNLVSLNANGNITVNAPTNPVDWQRFEHHIVALGAARTVTFGGGYVTAGPSLGPHSLARGQVLIARSTYIGNRNNSSDALTPAWAVEFVGITDVAASSGVPTSRQVIAGTGLTGGGDLSADRTLTVAYGSAASTAVQGNDARVTADQAVGTASIRTLGTGALQAAVGSHTHSELATLQSAINDMSAAAAAYIGASETSTSTSWTNLATHGPEVSITLAAARSVLILVKAELFNSATASQVQMTYAASGATTVAADIANAVMHNGSGSYEAYAAFGIASCNAGTTTFTAKYKVIGGTGRWWARHLVAVPL